MDNHSQRAAETIAKESPEGRPAFPGLRTRHVMAMLGIYIVALAGLSFALGHLMSVPLSFAVGGLGLVLAAANPAVWTSLIRIRERQPLLAAE